MFSPPFFPPKKNQTPPKPSSGNSDLGPVFLDHMAIKVAFKGQNSIWPDENDGCQLGGWWEMVGYGGMVGCVSRLLFFCIVLGLGKECKTNLAGLAIESFAIYFHL